jgi:hypothetical protein
MTWVMMLHTEMFRSGLSLAKRTNGTISYANSSKRKAKENLKINKNTGRLFDKSSALLGMV